MAVKKQMARPSDVRVSAHFWLSDFMACDSVVRNGYRNVFEGGDRHLEEAMGLAESVLEPMLVRSRLSISYGYISPELSRKIVKYQDPNKPSHHRWDDGAACDVVLHNYINSGLPPINAAWWMDENLPMSRTITYSESPAICVATRCREIHGGEPRHALYENRYMGIAKPKFVRYPESSDARRRTYHEALSHTERGRWRGQGHPSYHGGGRRQYQHVRTSKFTILLDFLACERAIERGIANDPGTLSLRNMKKFRRAGKFMDLLYIKTGLRRISINRAYEDPETLGEGAANWKDGVYLALVPPEEFGASALADAIREIVEPKLLKVTRDKIVWVGF